MTTTTLFTTLTDEELNELHTRLHAAWGRALDLKYKGLDGDYDSTDDSHYVTWGPVCDEIESVHTLVFNERNARELGCRWQPCGVCRHEACGFCPTCNPGAIAPNGEAYDDTEDTAATACCC